MTETSGIMGWIKQKIDGDAAITELIHGVFDSLAPENTARPYVIMQMQSPFTQMGTSIDGTIGIGRGTFLVKAVTESWGFATAEAINDLTREALHGALGTFNNVVIQECIHLSEVRYPETKEGVRYNHLGGLFRIFAYRT